MKDINPYMLPLGVLFVGVLITWLLFWELNLVQGQTESLTFSISSLGTFFGLFQVLLNISIKREEERDRLRHEEYKQANSILSEISNLLNHQMSEEVRPHALVPQLMNLNNSFINFNRMNNQYLFEDILENPQTIQVNEKLKEILVRTDELRKEMDDLSKDDWGDVAKKVYNMNWHNDIHELLSTYNELKYDYLGELQNYFK